MADLFHDLQGGWKLYGGDLEGDSVVWITHDGLDTGWYEVTAPGETLADLEGLGYVPTMYHDGSETPPMILFHHYRADAPVYALAPATGRFYECKRGR